MGLGFFTWLDTRVVRSVRVQRFRFLFPSWKFFDRVEVPVRLDYRIWTQPGGTCGCIERNSVPQDQEGQEVSECSQHPWVLWDPFLSSQARLSILFFHPRGNLKLALRTLVQECLQQIEEAPDDPVLAARWIRENLSYQLLRRALQQNLVLPGSEGRPVPYPYQFRIQVGAGPGAELALLSPWFKERG
jgi:hypothetical protein